MNVIAKPDEKEIMLTRTFKALRQNVWKAWTQPSLVARWYGPLENPVCELDVRPGGTYRIVMRSPEGVEYPIKGIYKEVDEPTRLVMTMDTSDHPAEWLHLFNTYRGARKDEPVQPLVLTARFEEQGNETTVTVLAWFADIAERDAHLTMGTTKGWSTSFDRLQALLDAK